MQGEELPSEEWIRKHLNHLYEGINTNFIFYDLSRNLILFLFQKTSSFLILLWMKQQNGLSVKLMQPSRRVAWSLSPICGGSSESS